MDSPSVRPCLHKRKTQIFPCGLASHLHKNPVFITENEWRVESLANSGLAVVCKQGNQHFCIVTRWSLMAFLIGRLFALSVGDTLPPGCFYHWCEQDYFYERRGGNSTF